MGRNYDYELSYDENIISIPKGEEICDNDYDVVGIGSGLFTEYPMLYDGMNEKGLCMGGLAFTGNAKYGNFNSNAINLAPYEMIPTILGTCKSVKDFKRKYSGIVGLNVWDKEFDENTQNAELHWFLCDKDDCIVIESTVDGVHIYENEFEVMTNNPPFDLMSRDVEDHLGFVGDYIEKDERYYSRGVETYYLDGSYTSMGRFERLVFLKENMEKNSILNPVQDSFKLLNSVEQLYGLTPVGNKFEYTIYQVVYDMENLSIFTRKYDENIAYPRDDCFFDGCETIVWYTL